MINKIEDIKYYLGPMTKNVIDSVIEYSNESGIPFGLIPSRRQIDWNGGYVGFNTKEFIEYVRSKSKNIIIERDHGGPGQGFAQDNGILSFHQDVSNKMDLIHIDPWKYYSKYEDGIKQTKNIMRILNTINPNVYFEIGTEEAIKKFSIDIFYKFLQSLKKELSDNLFSKIKYAVIQSGVRLKETQNIGKFDLDRCKSMLDICRYFGLNSKEHNGDYLSNEERDIRFNAGLTSINIAPELGVFETKILINHITKEEDFEKIFSICFSGSNWFKWVDNDFDPLINKEKLIEISGHYHNKEIKKIVRIDDELIKKNIKIELEKFK